MARFVIILRDTLSNLAGSSANDRIEIGVVARIAPEDLRAKRALLQLVGVTIQGVFDDIAEQMRISFTVFEKRICQQPFQLVANRLALGPAFRNPAADRRLDMVDGLPRGRKSSFLCRNSIAPVSAD
jgi:hypothetical protein